MAMFIVDRRQDPGSKSLENRQPLVRNERGCQLRWPNSLLFFSMRIATIAAPIGFADVGNYSLGVVMFDLERSN